MIWIAFAAHLVIYVLLGALIVKVGGRRLPEPFREMSVTVPLVTLVGMLLMLFAMPHWHLTAG